MIVESTFRPAWWLPGPHLQTIWPLLFGPKRLPPLHPERFELPDGDFLDLAWTEPIGGATVLILHGLEGGLESHYASRLLGALAACGRPAVFMHFRNCGSTPNRLPRSYHSGETGDLQSTLQHVRGVTGAPLACVVGYSLGGNVLLKWLGERGEQSLVKTAVAVSVPFNLADAAERLDRGLSRLYQRYLLRKLRASYRRKFRARALVPLPVSLEALRSFREFDDQITAPLHGFAGADDYYRRSSSRQFLKDIRTPTLILHARDDPFMWPQTAPVDSELSPSITLELAQHGGHVGFVAGDRPWQPEYWLEQRIFAHLSGISSSPEPAVAHPSNRATDPS